MMRRVGIVVSALAVAALAAVAVAAPPFQSGNNPAQDCKNDPGPPSGRAFGECVSTKARALQDSAAAAAAARHAAGRAAGKSHRAAHARADGASQRKTPFAEGDNPGQHCKNQPGPPTGRAFGECVSDRARSLNPSALNPANARQGPPAGVPQGPPAGRPPADRPPARAPTTGPRVTPPQGQPSDTPVGPPAGTPGPPTGGGPPDHP